MNKHYSYFHVLIAVLLVSFSSSVSALEFSGFASATYVSGDDENNNFALGKAELITEHNLSDKTYGILDIVFETEGGETIPEIERLSINHTINKLFVIGAGRYMEPLGFWNHNFAHGSLAQHTVSRPYLLEIEQHEKGFLPSHLIGLLIQGESDSWSYQFSMANGSGVDSSGASSGATRVFPLNNESPGDALTTLLRATYLVSDNLELGLTLSSNEFTETSDTGGLVNRGELPFKEKFVAIDFNYNLASFYLFGESYFMQFDDNVDMTTVTPNPDTYDATAYYMQFGYRATNKLTLVTRYESLDFDSNATLFTVQDIVPLTRTILGFNYALESSNSIRFEAQQTDPDGGDSNTIYYLQWFFYML